MRRRTRFYRKNEAEVIKSLGLIPTKNSGATWVEKEDGYNEYILAQLKSTEKESIKIKLKDIKTLEYNACVEHKIPVFIIQFITTNDIYILTKLDNISDIYNYLNTGKIETKPSIINEIKDFDNTSVEIKKIIKSNKKAKEEFYKEKEEKYKWKKSKLKP